MLDQRPCRPLRALVGGGAASFPTHSPIVRSLRCFCGVEPGSPRPLEHAERAAPLFWPYRALWSLVALRTFALRDLVITASATACFKSPILPTTCPQSAHETTALSPPPSGKAKLFLPHTAQASSIRMVFFTNPQLCVNSGTLSKRSVAPRTLEATLSRIYSGVFSRRLQIVWRQLTVKHKGRTFAGSTADVDLPGFHGLGNFVNERDGKQPVP